LTPIVVPFNLRDPDNSALLVCTQKRESESQSGGGGGRRGSGGAGGIRAAKPRIAKGLRSCVKPLQPVACAANQEGPGGLSVSPGPLSIADGFRALLLRRDGRGHPAAPRQSGCRFWREEATEAPGNKTLKLPLATSPC